MAITTDTFDQAIERKQHSWLATILGSQTFWVLIAVILAVRFPVVCDRFIRDDEEFI